MWFLIGLAVIVALIGAAYVYDRRLMAREEIRTDEEFARALFESDCNIRTYEGLYPHGTPKQGLP